MVKVRVFQNVGVGVAGAAALAGFGLGATGCSASAESQVGSSEAAATEMSAGTGTIEFHMQFLYGSTSGGDEFIRAGERLKATIAMFDIGYFIDKTDPEVFVALHAGKLSVALNVVYQREDGSQISQVNLPVTFPKVPANTRPAGNALAGLGTTAEFVVPSGAPYMKLAFVVTDDAGKTTRIGDGNLGGGGMELHPIFGAFLPNKVALFDNDGAGKTRVRVVEGGGLTPGKSVTISYTDWRADTAADRLAIDTTIGDGQTFNRFGAGIGPIRGDIKYEVTCTYSTDGGVTWVDGGTLDARQNPDVLNLPGDYRTSYEKTFTLPANATGLKIAFHLKAILVADPHDLQVTQWRDGIQLNGQYVKRDLWDNNGGANYDVPVTR